MSHHIFDILSEWKIFFIVKNNKIFEPQEYKENTAVKILPALNWRRKKKRNKGLFEIIKCKQAKPLRNTKEK